MKSFLALAAVVLLLPGSVRAQSAKELQRVVNREAVKVSDWAADEVLVDAVKSQNARKVSLGEVQRLDREWLKGRAAELARRVTTGPCADRLRSLVSKGPQYGETFVMDNQGALVCATQRTTDYWQGDEAKWIRAFDEGRGAVFIDRARVDDSARATLAQISLPIMEKGRAIGVITIGTDIRRVLQRK